jgi:hypothetical protein
MNFIVQLPLTSSSRMKSVRQLPKEQSRSLFVLSFDDRPGKLFDGLEHCRSVIFLSEGGAPGQKRALATTRYYRWPTETRATLFDLLEFANIWETPIYPDHFPKSASDLQEAVFQNFRRQADATIGGATAGRETEHFIFYQEATGYWVKATVGLPYYAKNGVEGPPAHGRFLFFDSEQLAHAACAILNSRLFYAYFITHGDCFHLSDTLVTGFPVRRDLLENGVLDVVDRNLMADVKANAEVRTVRTRDNDSISYAEFFAARSKPIIDQIDAVLGEVYGFTPEEADFVVNFDIKFRLGQEAANGEEQE